MTEQKDRGSSVSVLTTMGLVAALGVVVMVVWHRWHVEPWAARSSQHSYSAPGAFGDSFAPVVGFMTALALGAAIASVLMQRRELELQREEMQLQRDEMKAQREEMEEARKQWTAQAAAMADANVYAADANKLAAGAQLLEATRQIADLDSIASDLVDKQALNYANDDNFRDTSTLWVWLKYAKAKDEELQAFPEVFGAPEFRALKQRRSMLVRVAARVSASFET